MKPWPGVHCTSMLCVPLLARAYVRMYVRMFVHWFYLSPQTKEFTASELMKHYEVSGHRWRAPGTYVTSYNIIIIFMVVSCDITWWSMLIHCGLSCNIDLNAHIKWCLHYPTHPSYCVAENSAGIIFAKSLKPVIEFKDLWGSHPHTWITPVHVSSISCLRSKWK